MPINYSPRIGKNVIETLTLGMYEDPRFIYREYIQNAADQIDVAVEEGILHYRNEGKVQITIDNVNRRIFIEDNATGIKSDLVLRFLGDVANSQKDASKRKGFRGIGRLGGLGYCEKLVFETSYKGESVKSVMTLDAKLLKKIIIDRKDSTDAAGVISIITNISILSESKDVHYFKVCLEDVTNSSILNIANVIEYLSLVAPVPFNSAFTFDKEIIKYFKENNVSLDEYRIFLNQKRIYKLFKNTIIDNEKKSTILGVDFFKVRDGLGNLLALGWFGLRDNVNEVLTNHVPERGIRLRKNNIQIGGNNALNRFFKIERTNFRFIGELHAINPSLLPNARRDYFNDNKTCQVFERKLIELLKVKNWENKYAHVGSKIYNRAKDIELYKQVLAEYESIKDNIDSVAKEKHNFAEIKNAKDKALKASREIEKVRMIAETDNNIMKLYDFIIGSKDLSFDSDIEQKLQKNIYDPPSFTKLSENETIIVREIIDLIYETIEIRSADLLKKKIIGKYN